MTIGILLVSCVILLCVLAENICAIALIFIMFYGGFNTKWNAAKTVAPQAICLSTLGVVATAGITMLLCMLVLGYSPEESFLVGTVLSSTDAASVFAILRKKKLNLKDGTASVLEVESGSNDPVAYMMMVIAMSLMGVGKTTNVPVLIVMQILIFFLIGLLTFPHQMPAIIPMALAIVAFLTIAARPIAVFLLLAPFKCSVNQCLLISWAGLRGASSSVFAIMAVAGGISMKQDLFHIVFMVSLFSVAIQGTLLPMVARKLDMIDDNADVRKTFNDYQEENTLHLMQMYIPEKHNWANHKIKEISVPTGSLALMIKRGDETIVTKGDTRILAGDTVILSVPPYTPGETEVLEEKRIERKDAWCNKSIGELALNQNELIVMIIRNGETIIPNGATVMREEDVVVFLT